MLLRDVTLEDLVPHPDDDLSFLVERGVVTSGDWIMQHGYNSGDTLCMPGFIGHPRWSPGGSAYVHSHKKGLMFAEHIPESIVGRYFKSRQEESPDEFIPNFPRLEKVVDAYGHDRDSAVKTWMDRVRDPSCLTIHLRLGDFGVHPQHSQRSKDMKRVILTLLSRFRTVVVLTGLHFQTFTSMKIAQESTLDGLRFLKDMNRDNIFLCCRCNADDSLLLMREASHLLVSYGGFSMLGSMITKGNIYATPHILWIHFGDDGARWKEAMKHKNFTMIK